tara:strand:+ start:1059 stop:1220 length:162 start_codon:yes stop_codon:yes gene_type:complete
MTYSEMLEEIEKGGNVLVTLEQQQGLFSYCIKHKNSVDWRQEKSGDFISIWSA